MVWVAAIVTLWLGQEHLLFEPEPLQADAPLLQEPDVFERWVAVPGARLSVLELRQPDAQGVVFFLHGNNANLQRWFVDTAPYRRARLDLVMMDYRGFGKSTGRIASEGQLHADVEAVWQSVASRYAGKRIIACGRSLGSELAAAWAARHQPDLTILVSAYTNMREVAALHYPWIPGALLRYRLRTDVDVLRIHTPLVLFHGDQDALIPPSHSQRLARLAPHAQLVEVPGAGHTDIHQFDAYRTAFAAALTAPMTGR